MRTIYNVKHRYAILLKFGGKFLTSLIKCMLEAKTSICSTVKENLLFYCRKFSAFVVVVIVQHIFITRPVSQTPLAIESINVTTESLAFQSRHLNGAHSISDLKLPCS